MRVYARQAKNRDLEIDAAEIRIRAERRVGELIEAQKASIGLHPGRAAARRRRRTNGNRCPGGTGFPDPGIARPAVARTGFAADAARGRNRQEALEPGAAPGRRCPRRPSEAQLAGWRDRAQREGERVSVRLLGLEDRKSARAAREADLGARQVALPDRL